MPAPVRQGHSSAPAERSWRWGAGSISREIPTLQQKGARAVLLPFGLDGFLSEHKTIDYLPGVVGKAIAARHRAFEGLYVTPTGHVTEGTTTNVFALRGSRLLTPPVRALLPGVTRGHVIELAGRAGVRVAERPLKTGDLAGADEAFLTSALIEVLPLVRLDGKPIGTGRVGKTTRSIQSLYRQFTRERLSASGRF